MRWPWQPRPPLVDPQLMLMMQDIIRVAEKQTETALSMAQTVQSLQGMFAVTGQPVLSAPEPTDTITDIDLFSDLRGLSNE